MPFQRIPDRFPSLGKSKRISTLEFLLELTRCSIISKFSTFRKLSRNWILPILPCLQRNHSRHRNQSIPGINLSTQGLNILHRPGRFSVPSAVRIIANVRARSQTRRGRGPPTISPSLSVPLIREQCCSESAPKGCSRDRMIGGYGRCGRRLKYGVFPDSSWLRETPRARASPTSDVTRDNSSGKRSISRAVANFSITRVRDRRLPVFLYWHLASVVDKRRLIGITITI